MRTHQNNISGLIADGPLHAEGSYRHNAFIFRDHLIGFREGIYAGACFGTCSSWRSDTHFHLYPMCILRKMGVSLRLSEEWHRLCWEMTRRRLVDGFTRNA